MLFESVVQALKDGKMVKRSGSDKFVFMQVPSTIHRDIVPRMQSLPQSVKNEFERRFNDENEQIDNIYYSDQLAIVGASNLIVGWSPSPSDILACDWIIIED